MARRLTYEEVKYFIEVESGSGCRLLSREYVNAKQSLELLCSCGKSFTTTFDRFKSSNKRQCNKCSGVIKKDTNYFKKEVYELVGDEYVVFGEYVIARTKINIYHTKCSHTYDVVPDSFLSGTRCPKCFGKNLKTQEYFEKEVYDLYENEYQVLGRYINTNTKIKMKHNDCGNIWSIKPSHFLRGHKCPKCMTPNYDRDTSKFKREVYDIVQNEYSVISEYMGALSYIMMKHNECGHKYNVYPSAFLRGNRCPHCNNVSKGEEKIMLFLKQYNVIFEKEYYINQCRGKKRPLPFDYAIFKEGILISLIEYDGKQHFEPVNFGGISDKKALETHKYTKKNDNVKNQYCKDNNIPLLRIPYWEFDNIERILEEWLEKHGVLHKNDKIA